MAKQRKSAVGAVVRYCGHQGTFVADLIEVGNTVVVHASQPVTMENLNRSPVAYAEATHHVVDFPGPFFWKPKLGIFVVLAKQVEVLK